MMVEVLVSPQVPVIAKGDPKTTYNYTFSCNLFYQMIQTKLAKEIYAQGKIQARYNPYPWPQSSLLPILIIGHNEFLQFLIVKLHVKRDLPESS